ncbi:hypothetical protein MHY_11550 [Megamonas hypermegale ART12/1]|nr:hypothetical protein MHY_11550 [Megamonas hypermegale ART12/1]
MIIGKRKLIKLKIYLSRKEKIFIFAMLKIIFRMNRQQKINKMLTKVKAIKAKSKTTRRG